jgi:hypothetical protein
MKICTVYVQTVRDDPFQRLVSNQYRMYSFFRQLIKQNADRERNNKKGQEMAEVIIGNRVEAPETPRFVHTVMQASQKSMHANNYTKSNI